MIYFNKFVTSPLNINVTFNTLLNYYYIRAQIYNNVTLIVKNNALSVWETVAVWHPFYLILLIYLYVYSSFYMEL